MTAASTWATPQQRRPPVVGGRPAGRHCSSCGRIVVAGVPALTYIRRNFTTEGRRSIARTCQAHADLGTKSDSRRNADLVQQRRPKVDIGEGTSLERYGKTIPLGNIVRVVSSPCLRAMG